jgi:hypothetical protein
MAADLDGLEKDQEDDLDRYIRERGLEGAAQEPPLETPKRKRGRPRKVPLILDEGGADLAKEATKATLGSSGTPKPAPPKRVRPRVPLGGGLSQIIGALGVGLIMTGRDPGVGMALQFEAPIAGERLDEWIRGTALDRIAQPFARAGKAGKEVGSVIALPFLVGLIERRPELYPVLREPLLRPLVVEMAIQLEQAGQRSAKRLQDAQRKGSGVEVDSDALLAMLFEGRPPVPQETGASSGAPVAPDGAALPI